MEDTTLGLIDEANETTFVAYKPGLQKEKIYGSDVLFNQFNHTDAFMYFNIISEERTTTYAR